LLKGGGFIPRRENFLRGFSLHAASPLTKKNIFVLDSYFAERDHFKKHPSISRALRRIGGGAPSGDGCGM
jgi:hypothetical protein